MKTSYNNIIIYHEVTAVAFDLQHPRIHITQNPL